MCIARAAAAVATVCGPSYALTTGWRIICYKQYYVWYESRRCCCSVKTARLSWVHLLLFAWPLYRKRMRQQHRAQFFDAAVICVWQVQRELALLLLSFSHSFGYYMLFDISFVARTWCLLVNNTRPHFDSWHFCFILRCSICFLLHFFFFLIFWSGNDYFSHPVFSESVWSRTRSNDIRARRSSFVLQSIYIDDVLFLLYFWASNHKHSK